MEEKRKWRAETQPRAALCTELVRLGGGGGGGGGGGVGAEQRVEERSSQRL